MVQTLSLSKVWLPTDLLSVILSKLPAKSVIRFRSVSKTWRCTIENKEFIKSYKKRSESQLFALHLERGIVELAVRCSKTFRVVKAEHEFPSEVRQAQRVIGCVDGLFLLQSHADLRFWNQSITRVWWNPSIRRVSLLPLPSLEEEGGQTWGVGTGFDPWIKDYKHVRIPSTGHHHHEIDSVMVYTMGTNSWRKQAFKNKGGKPWYFIIHFDLERVCIRGIMYSVALTLDPSDMKTEKEHLVSFDLSTEEFSYADLPKEDNEVVEYDREWHVKCASDGSRLALVSIRGINGSIWRAHGEGGDVTWSKHYAFYLTIPIGFRGGMGYVLNIDLNEDSIVLLLKVGNSVTLYNVTQSHDQKTLLYKDMTPPYNFENTVLATSYVQSLAFLS